MDVVRDERGSMHWCSVRNALSFSLLILSGTERKTKSEYSSSSCSLQPFYSTCFDLLKASCRHSNGSKSQCLCIRSFSPSFAISLTRTCLFVCLSHLSPLFFSLCVSSLSLQLLGGFSSSFSSLV
ncbi:hypothetical protein GOODEAATRI_001305 [Goodea atripinnis]|uniref:Transmembrane protein n=1 Tax=Goodea atripinnis TaxID=208336 RepID=A0ABV0MXS6_9TELE